MSVRYLYLRTQLALEHSSGLGRALDALEAYQPEVLALGRQGLHWRDGFVVRFYSRDTPAAICDWLAPSLDGLEAWACHDGSNRCVDYPKGAQASTFFQGLGSRSVSQLFLRYRKEDLRDENLIARLRAKLEGAKAKCRPVVDFRDGQILLIAGMEPQKITFHRCQDHLRDRIAFAFVDAAGVCFTAVGIVEDSEAWQALALGSFGASASG